MVGEAITSRFRMCYELGGGLFNAGVLCCLVRIGMYKQTLGMFGRREESNIIMFEIFPREPESCLHSECQCGC